MTTICTLCARGGSTGVPRKNVRNLLGRPLISYTIEQALNSKKIDQVFVSTDDDEIASVAKEYGAIVPYMRPPELATSEAGKLSAIIHLVEYLELQGISATKIVDLDPTSPLRTLSDIDNAIELLKPETDVVITGYEADKNPYFNMVEEKEDGTIGLVKQMPVEVLARQAAPKVYSMNASIYVWHAHTLRNGLWARSTKIYEMPHMRSVDIDNEIDFKLVELLMAESQNLEHSNV